MVRALAFTTLLALDDDGAIDFFTHVMRCSLQQGQRLSDIKRWDLIQPAPA